MYDKDHIEKLEHRVDSMEKVQAAQTEQIKTLFSTTREMSQHQQKLVEKVLAAIVLITILAVLGLLYGALGSHGFNAIVPAAMGSAH